LSWLQQLQETLQAEQKIGRKRRAYQLQIRNQILYRSFLDLGLTPGTKIRVSRVAPLKGPVEIAARGSKLALGDEIACNVFVEKATG